MEPEVLIHDCSVGTNAIINFLLDPYVGNDLYPSSVWMINARTLVRNCTDNSLDDKTILQNVLRDFELIQQHLVEYFAKTMPVSNLTPIIVLYLPNYPMLELYERPDSKARARHKKILYSLSKMLRKDREVSNVNGVRVEIHKVGKHRSPCVELMNILSVDKLVNFRHAGQIATMISHCPVDWHVSSKINNLYLLESYTGEIISPKSFGEKIFDVDYVPFYPATHFLFGDRDQIKPMVMRASKTFMLERANKNRWKFKTESQIVRDIKSTGMIPTELLTTVKL